MNPGNKLEDIEFLWRRLTESFPDWAVGLPVLFAFLVLFIIASFRRDKGIAGLFWGMGMFFVVPLLMASRPERATGNFSQDVLVYYGGVLVGGLIVAGFLLHLLKDLTPIRLGWWNLLVGAGLVFGYALWERQEFVLFPMHVKLAPIFLLFFLQVFLTAWRTGMIWGFAGLAVVSAAYVPLALMFKPVFSWWVVLAPTLLAALFYVGLMYIQDAKSIHPAWAGFLGLLRCTVYAILAFVFLLPGCQTFDTSEFYPKVLMLFDVSGSMNTRDDLLAQGQKPETLLSRQDKVIQMLTAELGADKKPRTPFMAGVAEKSPVNAYRFGTIPDVSLVAFDKDKLWTASEWKAWLTPDKKEIDGLLERKERAEEELHKKTGKKHEKKTAEDRLKDRARMLDLYESLVSGTNVPGSALQIAKAEAGSYLQAVIIFSDGQSNVGDAAASIREFLARVNNPKRRVPVFTVGVGEYRQPAEIRIVDLQAPQTARPDDKFPVRIPVVGQGLGGEEFDIFLDVTRTKDSLGNPLKGEKKFTLNPKRGTFKGGGDNPQDTIEFEIDLQDLKGIKSADDKNRDLEGEWEVVARVPRHPRESFADPEHKTDPPTRVQVQNKELRILLFAGGPTRDYQFIRTLLYREVQEKRMELSVFLQQDVKDDVDQDVPKERLLTHFPNRLGQDDPADKFSSLNMYDVIIAIDPDWTALDANQIKLLEQWVSRDAGGIIFMAGPVNTFQLSRSREELTPIKTILPVVFKDFRLTPIGLGQGVDTSRPYPLRFMPVAKTIDFLKLDESEEGGFAGWDRFFWGEAKKPEAGKDAKPLRGMYNFYPLEKANLNATVLATFAGPEATKINDGKDEQPYIVTMPYGSGKTVYLGSGETWRLRQFKETFHERLWIKMARYAAAGSTQQKKYGRILMGRRGPTGPIPFEAQIKGSDLFPLPKDTKPLVIVKKRNDAENTKPETFDLRAKATQGDWHGWFTGTIKLKEPGEYEFSIPIPNTTETLSQTIEIFKPNLEEANVRENHKELYQIATDAAPILKDLSGDDRKEVERVLQPISDDIRDGKEGARLFFPLKYADSIPKCLRKLDPRVERTKGALQDLWDRGESLTLYHFLWSIPLGLGLLAFFILLFHERYVWAWVALALALVTPLAIVGVQWLMQPEWMLVAVDFSFVLVTVVALLALEWLTRKLLKLA